MFCDENSCGTLTEIEWNEVKNTITTLEPFNKYSKKLQSETVTMSDFFGFWTLLRIKVSKSTDQFSEQLLTQMNKYHEMLMDNPIIIAAVYLDPRYQRALGPKKSLAVKFLADLYEKILKIESTDDASAATETIDREEGDSYEELNEYLDACGSVYNNDRTTPSTDTPNLKDVINGLLNDFDGEELPITASILEYWKKQSATKPELYKLASVLMAIPPTQTVVERLFSALALVLTSHRTNLGDQILENILLVRANHDLLINYKHL